MKKFCPKCGKTIKTGKFCNNCTETELDYRPISIKLCPSNKFFFKGKWTNFKDLRTLTTHLLNLSFKQEVELETGLEQYELLNKPGLKKDLPVTIMHEGYVYPVNIHVETTYSPGVAKLGSQYFEGILQVRNTRPEINEYVKNYLQKNKIHLNNLVEKNKSADYYFIDKKKIKKVANMIITNFSGNINYNEQLFSRNHLTSKDIYRVNALLTIPSFKEKDTVIIDNNPIYITNLGKENTGLDLEKNKKTTFQFNDKTNYEILPKHKSQISKTSPNLEILNENFQSVTAENPMNLELKQGKKINFVFYKKYFIVK